MNARKIFILISILFLQTNYQAAAITIEDLKLLIKKNEEFFVKNKTIAKKDVLKNIDDLKFLSLGNVKQNSCLDGLVELETKKSSYRKYKKDYQQNMDSRDAVREARIVFVDENGEKVDWDVGNAKEGMEELKFEIKMFMTDVEDFCLYSPI